MYIINFFLKRLSFAVLVAFLLVFSGYGLAYAQFNDFDKNAIDIGLEWLPSGDACEADLVFIAGENNRETAFNYFVSKGLTAEQSAGIVGNLIDESGVDPSNVQNSFTRATGIQDGLHDPTTLWRTNDEGKRVEAGYGIAQWTTTDRKARFKALADGTNRAYNDIVLQLDLIWFEMTGEPTVDGVTGGGALDYALSDLLETTTVADATISFLTKFEGSRRSIEARQNGEDLYEVFSDRIGYAEDVYSSYSAGAGGSYSCVSVPAGDLVATALYYAWPAVQQPSANPVAKQEYTNAIALAQQNGEYVGGGKFPGIDCGGFVTRVMRDSGYDPTYNSYQGNTAVQKRYLDENWQVIEVNSTADLQPGDVAMRRRETSGHTYFYVGAIDNFETEVASAAYDAGSDSDDWRAPAAGHENPLDPTYTWYRKVN